MLNDTPVSNPVYVTGLLRQSMPGFVAFNNILRFIQGKGKGLPRKGRDFTGQERGGIDSYIY